MFLTHTYYHTFLALELIAINQKVESNAIEDLLALTSIQCLKEG